MVRYREEMDYFEHHHYSFVRLILCYIGLWPYTDRRIRFVITSVQILTLTLMMFSVSLKFIIMFPSVESFIYTLGILMITFMSFLTYILFVGKMAQMKKLWEHIEHDWKKLERTDKIFIAEQYAYKSNLLSVYVLILDSIYYAFTSLDVYLPYMLATIVPLKQPHRQKLLIPVELTGKYDVFLNLIAGFLFLQAGIVATVLISEFIIFVHHACLLFSLVGDILERGFMNIEAKNNVNDKNKILYETVVESVRYHRAAIRFAKIIEQVYNFTCFYVMVAIIIIFTSCLLRIFYMILLRNLLPTIASILSLLCLVGVSFIVTHMGQLLIDHSLDVFDKTCAVPWYMASLKTQKLLLLILTRSVKSSCITHGKMTILAHTLFTTLLHSAVSFTTVFISIQ